MGESKFRLNQLQGRLGDLVYQFTRVHFPHSPAPDTWSPPINAYRCPHGFAICVELAGVPKDSIQVEVHQRTLRIEGSRQIPEPKGKDEEPVQILAMEIDTGRFARELVLPADVESDAVRAEYKEGFLWVYLPFRSQA